MAQQYADRLESQVSRQLRTRSFVRFIDGTVWADTSWFL